MIDKLKRKASRFLERMEYYAEHSPHWKKAVKVCPYLYPWCELFPKSVSILSDGRVTTCCVDAAGKNVFGSIYKDDISTIWENKIRNVLFGGVCGHERCKECPRRKNAFLLSGNRLYLPIHKFLYKYPRNMVIEPIAECNYGCCLATYIHKFRETTKLDLDRTFEHIRSFLPELKLLTLFNVGEPLLHEGLCDFVRKCRGESKKLVILISTNGILLNEKISKCFIEQKLNYLDVSIHGGPGTENMLKYSKYGADYDKVLGNIKEFVELRKKAGSELPRLHTKTVLFNWNDTDEMMDRLRSDLKKAGADRVFWVLDAGREKFPTRASKRFTPGSKALEEIRQRREFMRNW